MTRKAASEQQTAGSLNVAAIAAYIRANCTHVTLSQAAGHFACHPNSVTRLLKRELGQTFSELVATFRIEKARDLLAHDDITVHDVALACGYANATHFYAVFKQHCGVTPSAYHLGCLAHASDPQDCGEKQAPNQETCGARTE